MALGDAWQLQFAAWNSRKVATATTVLLVLLGVAGALGIARSRRLSARVLDGLFMVPLILPALAFGLAALMLFSAVGLPVSPLTLTLGHTVVCVPFVVRNTVASLQQLDPSLLEGSATLGASRFYTFRRVVLPLVRPGILAGGFICFMASFDNIPVSLFLRDAATDMLPIRMWQEPGGQARRHHRGALRRADGGDGRGDAADGAAGRPVPADHLIGRQALAPQTLPGNSRPLSWSAPRCRTPPPTTM